MASRRILARVCVPAIALAALALAGSTQAQGRGKATLGTPVTEASKKTLLVFPFDVGTTVPGQFDVSVMLTDVARSRLIATDMYTVVQFYKTLAPVARLHNDQVLSDTDIQAPFAEDNAKAIKVTKAVGYDVAFVGSVDDYSYNEADKQANITVSGRLLEIGTGKILKSATLSGASSKGGNAKEPERALEAARTAGEQLMGKIVPEGQKATPTPVATNPPPRKTTPPPSNGNGHKKRGSNNLLLGLLAALAIGLGVGLSSGGGHGGGGVDLPPPPP